MKEKIAKFLTFSILIITVSYGIGEYLHWWDYLSGRSNALNCYERFASNKNYPEIWIKNTEPEFSPLIKFIESKTKVLPNNLMLKHKLKLTAVVRVGGTLGHEIQKQIHPKWPKVTFIPETSPIAFVYSSKDNDEQKIDRVCSIGDIKQWVNENRENERFYVLTIAIGILSIALCLMESKKKT